MFSKYLTDTSRLVIFIASCIFFLLRVDISVLDVTNVNWIYRLTFDTGTELISWNYYRQTPWHFPIIGYLEGYDYPTETGVGMTGIVASLGVFFKLFSKWLPDSFQYIGWWFLACFVLQGHFVLKLLRGVKEQYNLQISQADETLAALFFVIAPPMLHRMGHINMFGHFVLLAALAIYFSSKKPRKKVINFLLLTAFVASASQYLTVMVMAIAAASFIEMWQRSKLTFTALILSLVSLPITVFCIFYVLGNFVIPFEANQQFGFGSYASNLNTFYNPQGYSPFLPTLPLSDSNQYEGFAYLGFGSILMLATTFVFNFIKKFRKNEALNVQIHIEKVNLYPLIFIAVLFFIYALSCNIGFNDKVIHRWYYGGLSGKVFDSLRASGRFIWLPFYLIMLFGFINFFKLKINFKIKTALLASFLIVQIIDIQKLITNDKTIFEKCSEANCPHLKWKPIFSEAEKVVTLPLYAWNFKEWGDFLILSRAASEEKKAITTGYFARRNMTLLKKYEAEQYEKWQKGDLGENKNAVFVGQKQKLWRLKAFVEKGELLSFDFDGYAVLVPPTHTQTINYIKNSPYGRVLEFKAESVADFLRKNKNNTIIVSALDEATFKLDDETRKGFAEMGSTDFAKLDFRGSFVAIIHKGKTIFEDVNNESSVKKDFKKGDILKSNNTTFSFLENLHLTSGGANSDGQSEIKINDKEFSPRKRGLNFVVLNDKFEVIETTFFDTYEETSHAIFK